LKKKIIFIGDINSINVELINKSHQILKEKVKYILIGNIEDLSKELKYISSKLKINQIYDPIKFSNYDKNKLNLYNVNNVSKAKYKNMLNQIKLSNLISNITGYDLVTMPINKSIFKKKIEFIGMTEYLGKINKKQTFMLMYGNKFSIIPLTTHINLKNVYKSIKKEKLIFYIKGITALIKKKIYGLKIKKIIFLCFNPHCGEKYILGNEDRIIKKSISNFKNLFGPFSADSAFINIPNNSLYISMYHDQALIPFKIINKKSFNLTIGLDYRRLSPAHGTAIDIKHKGIANNSSFIECMLF
jgi:4-hydroxythreonine-4-phosphate dehydrogenase